MKAEIAEEGSLEIISRSPGETRRLGNFLGELLHPGDVVALIGDLGTGKTTLAKGICGGAGVEDENDVSSPSFVLVNEYQGRFPIYHADLYRLQDVREVEDLGWEEFLFGEGVSLLEWAEKFPGIFPQDRIEIRIFWLGPEERKIRFAGAGTRSNNVVGQLQKKWDKEE